ncbi:MAG: bifunctional (p)ppGpp synthetase/guanosine-3',5'-bis(diphosphate) 3'-pyrophosphohydrolase [Acidimicrobiales bacterium]
MPTVLPWRRSSQAGMADDVLGPLLAEYRARRPRADTGLVTRAYREAEQAHEGQLRKTGDPYITHPVAVATILAKLGLDEVTLAAALLHDAVEDTSVTLEDIEERFGAPVAEIVDGLTKLDRVKFASKEAQQAATVRKMLIAMAKDGRVLLIKLADRLHNMRTIAAMDEERQHRTAQETLDIYAPLAHRLGIQDVRWQLEDLSFAALYPRRYAEIEQMVTTRAPERELYLAQVLEQVQDRLETLKIQGEVTGRPKHHWSIYEKMVVKGKEFDDIFDLVGIRVVVERESDCYAALGCIHGSFSPVQGRIKDYISMPKFNLYRSLHTTVIGPGGKPLEVQIRTREMHRWAEFGIAAHWGYKEGRGNGAKAGQENRLGRPSGAQVAWMSRIGDMDTGAEDPAEFLESLKLDLEQDEVYVFTPAGDVQTLPTGATPVDFAYAIHTDVGHRCIGARINGRLMPLDTELASGDAVEVVTAKVPTAAPSRDWLGFVATARARTKIRQWFSRERREDAIDSGREELVKALRKAGLPVQKLQSSAEMAKLAQSMNHADLESLHVAIGEGHVSATSVVQRLERELRGHEAEVQLPSTARHAHSSGTGRPQVGVHVEGMDDLMVRLSRCCTPVPGDEIIGFVTRGRGVSVHRADCSNASDLQSSEGRMIEVEWDDQRQGSFVASIEVKALDRSRLLSEVSRVLSEHHVNIINSSSHTGSDRVSKMRFEFELADPAHLEHVVAAMRRIDSVYDAYRLLPGKADKA